MSGLAELLVRQGHEVSGSDAAESAITRRLQKLGVRVFLGHRAENLGAAQVVVHTTAVKEDNPELAAARSSGRAILRRGQMQARLMEGYTQVAITGAHGKTSTTAMTAAVLRAGGLDPSILVGAMWDNLGSNAVLGRGDYFVAEADESDGSFLHLSPEIAVITNIDREHLDFYGDLDHIREAFARYLAKLPPEAQIVAWRDDPYLAPLLEGRPQRIITYSLLPGADLVAKDIRVE
jgi:UDP-N-acetylmuramate--alanine ligase